MELEEERKARHDLEQRIFEQEKKLENLMNRSMSLQISSSSTQVMVLKWSFVVYVGILLVEW